MDRRGSAFGHSNRTVLELRNLPERVENWIGQLVRGGFVVAERDEDGAAWHAIVGARVERDPAAPGFDRERLAWRDSQLLEIERVRGGDRLRLDVVEHRGAP